MEDGAIPATVAIPNGYVRLDPRDILKETDLVFVCQPGRAPIFRPTISAGCMAGEDMIYIRRLRAPASPPKPEGQEWPFTDPKAMESIERGIADAKAGRIYGTGEGMREAGRPREALGAIREFARIVAEKSHPRSPIGDLARSVGPELDAIEASLVEAAPAPQGLREAAAIRDFVARTEARARSMSGTAPGWVFLREAMKAEMSLLGAASASVSPKGEPSNPSISSNGSPSSPVIPDNSHKGEG